MALRYESRIDGKGRVTLSRPMRERLRIRAGAALAVWEADGLIMIEPLAAAASEIRIDAKGRVVLPKSLRDAAQLRPGLRMLMRIEAGVVALVPSTGLLARQKAARRALEARLAETE